MAIKFISQFSEVITKILFLLIDIQTKIQFSLDKVNISFSYVKYNIPTIFITKIPFSMAITLFLI